MVNITNAPVQTGDSFSTKYEGSVTTALTDYKFPSVQDSIFVHNYGFHHITAISGGEKARIGPNGGVHRFTVNTDTVSLQASFLTSQIAIEGRSYSLGRVDERSDVQAINAQNLKPSRFAYTPKKQVIEYWKAGHGWSKTSPAGSSISDDLINFRTGKQAFKLTTTSTSNVCFAEKLISMDVLSKGIEVDVYIEDATKITSIDLLLSATTNFTNYFATGFPVASLKNGWNTLNFIPTDFARLGGTPPVVGDLAAIQLIRVKIQTTSVADAKDVSVTFDRMQTLPNPFSRGKVVLRFDDGHNTVYSEAKPAMDKHGFRGVAYVITNQHESNLSNRMTMQELYTLQNLGWDISSHTVDHLGLIADNPSAEEIERQLRDSKKWLLEKGFKGADHLATPGGQYTPAILDVIKKYYATHGTVSEAYEYFPFADPHKLKIRNVVNNTTVATVQAWIDKTVSNKCLTILTFHYFMSPADVSTKVLPADFQAMMDYLATADVDVVTMTDLAGYRASM